jgi:hypothetical protein
MTEARVAVTFSGKYGDILWSLPTVRELAKMWGPVDFYCMPAFESICDLLKMQPYIGVARGLPGWGYQSDACGAQPREHPLISGYERVFDLTYPTWPDMPLVQFTAKTAGVALPDQPLPFLENVAPCCLPPVDIAYNFKFPEKVEIFLFPLVRALSERLGRPVFAKGCMMPGWVDTALIISAARLFVGDRSSNQVIAHGLGKPTLIYETDTGRHSPIFSCPYGREIMPVPVGTHLAAPLNLGDFVEAAASVLEKADVQVPALPGL